MKTFLKSDDGYSKPSAVKASVLIAALGQRLRRYQ